MNYYDMDLLYKFDIHNFLITERFIIDYPNVLILIFLLHFCMLPHFVQT